MAWSLIFENKVGRELTPFPVVTSPPPPHRAVDLAGVVAADTQAAIDTAGFNPIYLYQPLPQIAGPNGFIVQMDLDAPQAGSILVVTYRYKVAPGKEGSDPGKQPTQIAEFPFTGLTEGDYKLTAGLGMAKFQLLPVSTGGGGGGSRGGCLLLPFALLVARLLERL